MGTFKTFRETIRDDLIEYFRDILNDMLWDKHKVFCSADDTRAWDELTSHAKHIVDVYFDEDKLKSAVNKYIINQQDDLVDQLRELIKLDEEEDGVDHD